LSDLLLYRILSGKTRIKVDNEVFFVKGTTSYQKYLAEEYYEQLVEDYGILDDFRTEGELFGWMVKHGYWAEENEAKLTKIKKDIEDFKVRLYELKFQGQAKKTIKDAIREAKKKLELLLEQKHRFDFLTVHGAATIAKNKYLMALSVYDRAEQPIFTEDSYFHSSFPYLDKIIVEYNGQGISTEKIRFLARSDSWRKYWCARESDNVFGQSTISLTDDQLSLVSWTRIYDNVYQHPDCPVEAVIEDDDALDGFLIADRRKRDREKGLTEADTLITNEKIRNADEVFLVADNFDDAKRIYDLNSNLSRQRIRQREKIIEEKGIVQDMNLPDVAQKLQMDINNKQAQLMRGGK
jgi:hypothetical protein